MIYLHLPSVRFVIIILGGVVPHHGGNVSLAVHHDPRPRRQQRDLGANAGRRRGEAEGQQLTSNDEHFFLYA